MNLVVHIPIQSVEWPNETDLRHLCGLGDLCGLFPYSELLDYQYLTHWQNGYQRILLYAYIYYYWQEAGLSQHSWIVSLLPLLAGLQDAMELDKKLFYLNQLALPLSLNV